jgi:hypothetical protein
MTVVVRNVETIAESAKKRGRGLEFKSLRLREPNVLILYALGTSTERREHEEIAVYE